jgi:hypothetical protein
VGRFPAAIPGAGGPHGRVLAGRHHRPPEVGPLAHQLAGLGVPAPTEDQIGYELNDQGWQAEIAWAAPRVAVVADGDEECVAAFAAAGWDARAPGDWTPDDLAARIMGEGK